MDFSVNLHQRSAVSKCFGLVVLCPSLMHILTVECLSPDLAHLKNRISLPTVTYDILYSDWMNIILYADGDGVVPFTGIASQHIVEALTDSYAPVSADFDVFPFGSSCSQYPCHTHDTSYPGHSSVPYQ